MKLPEGWEPVPATAFVDELRRELAPVHVLHGRTVTAVARRCDSDDVAFLVDGARLCVVHLTWRVETQPEWPCAMFIDTLDEWD